MRSFLFVIVMLAFILPISSTVLFLGAFLLNAVGDDCGCIVNGLAIILALGWIMDLAVLLVVLGIDRLAIFETLNEKLSSEDK